MPARKKILLLGRSGSGKSTVATMLYKRTIDGDNTEFTISSSAIGTTIDKQVRHSRDGAWEIYDTVGLGESVGGAVPDREAKWKLVQLLKDTNRGFDYICMLKKEDRFDIVDHQVIAFVNMLFKPDELKTNMFYLISTDKDDWIERNTRELSRFINVDNAITINFPDFIEYDSPDEKLAKELIRERSLKRLEGFLARANTELIYPRTRTFITDREYNIFVNSMYKVLHQVQKATLSTVDDILKMVDKFVNFKGKSVTFGCLYCGCASK